MTEQTHIPMRASDRWVGLWLVAMAALVVTMIIVGGLTRLTDSGLSITEWKPVTGAIPPLSAEAWESEFALYREIPEYQLQNRGMSLEEFKVIYWWEWGHRFLGRVIGLAFIVPLVAFWATGAVRPHLRLRLAGLFLLGGLQGFVGWWMVASGLVDRVDVSHIRLAVHLGLAFVILGALSWTALDAFDGPERNARSSAFGWAAAGLSGLLFAQILLGALVAGLDAGRTYTSWPLMDGGLVPVSYWGLEPWWRSLIDNHPTVQFNHRLVGYIAVLAGLAFAIYARGRAGPRAQTMAGLLAVGMFAQGALGVITLINVAPLNLAIAHQGLAAALFILAVALAREAFVGAQPPNERAAPLQSHHPEPAR